MRNAVLRCNNRKKAPFSHWLNVDFVWVCAAFFLIVMMSWWCNVISGKWCNKCDSVWILESRCIGSIMRHINLDWTKYDVTEDLGVKCTSSPSSRGCTCQSHRARVSHPTFSTNYFMFTHFHINILPAKADPRCRVCSSSCRFTSAPIEHCLLLQTFIQGKQMMQHTCWWRVGMGIYSRDHPIRRHAEQP